MNRPGISSIANGARSVPATLLLSFLVVVFAWSATCRAERPNIVLIMADDMGLGDISYHAEKFQQKKPIVQTPAMDGLARDGMWFSDAHSATSLCSPTRYCVMSGNMNYRSYAPWGVWGSFRKSPFEKGRATLGTVASSAGYKTGFIGKWHLGGDFLDSKSGEIYRNNKRKFKTATVDLTKMVGGGPSSVGFGYDFTIPCGIQGPIYAAYENNKWFPLADDSKIIFLDRESAIDPKFVSDKGPGLGDSAWDTREIGKLLSGKAVDFIDRNSDSPFFLYYCSPYVHIPHCVTDDFDGKKIAGATPSNHLDALVDLDCQVARIVNKLKEIGLYDNTLIILTSDNGGLGQRKSIKAGHDPSGGWRGFKNSPHEGGHRVPFVVTWKQQETAGKTCDQTVINQDVVATMADLLDVSLDENDAMDSLNLLPLITGQGEFQPREYLMMQAGSKHEAMFRKGPWKLILQSNHKVTKFEPIALFNLESNAKEKEAQNLVDDSGYAERVKQMTAEYLEIRESGRRTTPALSAATK